MPSSPSSLACRSGGSVSRTGTPYLASPSRSIVTSSPSSAMRIAATTSAARDAQRRRARLVDAHRELGRIVFDRVVDTDDVGVAGELGADALGDGVAAGLVGPVDLRDERREHRRAGRHFHHLDLGPQRRADAREFGPHRGGDLVALAVAVVLVDQVDLQVAILRRLPQVVLPHQAVEVDRRGRARIALVVGHLGNRGHVRAQRAQRGGGVLHRRARRHVDHDLEFRLVVERQHLQHHPLHDGEQQRQQYRRDDAGPQPAPVAASGVRIKERRQQPR